MGSLNGHENRVSCLGVSNDGMSLCTGSWDSTVSSIEAVARQELIPMVCIVKGLGVVTTSAAVIDRIALDCVTDAMYASEEVSTALTNRRGVSQGGGS